MTHAKDSSPLSICALVTTHRTFSVPGQFLGLQSVSLLRVFDRSTLINALKPSRSTACAYFYAGRTHPYSCPSSRFVGACPNYSLLAPFALIAVLRSMRDTSLNKPLTVSFSQDSISWVEALSGDLPRDWVLMAMPSSI